ncbi:MAG TPA: hypothetical protein VH373_18990 [Jatrophihabitantaceae bacterium]|jgi:hypothetical protein
MARPSWSENRVRPPGEAFQERLRLSGWEAHSSWGYDAATDSYVATLRRNDGDNVQEVGREGPPLRWADCIAAEVLDRTGCDPVSAVRALGIARPRPALRRTGDLVETLAKWLRESLNESGSGYQRGRIAGLAWIVAGTEVAPASAWRSGGDVPAAERVDAECVIARGRVYVGGHQPRDFYTGVEEALEFALRS